ncbi:hypothetical protein C8R45DRAFT_1084406 [Mycena sanguinolenta]|nr:hypothetical protein C8R45DRAFT_1084406 [Mycena sanguinolenta]
MHAKEAVSRREDSYLALRESLIERSLCDKESTIRSGPLYYSAERMLHLAPFFALVQRTHRDDGQKLQPIILFTYSIQSLSDCKFQIPLFKRVPALECIQPASFYRNSARLTIYSIDLQTVHLHVLYMLGTRPYIFSCSSRRNVLLHIPPLSRPVPLFLRLDFDFASELSFASDSRKGEHHARTFVCVAPDEITLEESLFIQTSAYHSYPQHPETIILNESMTDYTTHGSHVSANISFTVCESPADIAPCIMVTSVPRAVLQSSRQSRISLTPSVSTLAHTAQ